MCIVATPTGCDIRLVPITGTIRKSRSEDKLNKDNSAMDVSASPRVSYFAIHAITVVGIQWKKKKIQLLKFNNQVTLFVNYGYSF